MFKDVDGRAGKISKSILAMESGCELSEIDLAQSVRALNIGSEF